MSPIPEMNSSKGSNSFLQTTMKTQNNQSSSSFYKNTIQPRQDDERKLTGTGQYNLDQFDE